MKKKILSTILALTLAMSALFAAQIPVSAATTYKGDSITLGAKNNQSDTYIKTFNNVKTISVPGHTFSVYKWNEWKCSKSDYVDGYVSSRVIKNSDGTFTLYLWSRADTGTGTINVNYNNGDVYNHAYTVKPAPSSVSVSTDSVTLNVGESYGISESTNKGTYANASNLSWSSSNTKVATVTKGNANKATIKAVGAGTANISIKLYNGKTASCKVTVNPTNVTQGDNITLGAKSNGKSDTCTKTFKNVSSITVPGHTFSVSNWDKWNCSKSDYVDGYISSRVVKNSDNTFTLYLWSRADTGTGTIKVNYNNGDVCNHTYTVKPAPTIVKLSETSLSLKSGNTFTITESTPNAYANARGLVWTSSNSEIATVTKGSGNKAEIKAVSSGEATITMTTYNGVSASCTVKVNWHDAEYKIINHPAETEQVWVVDKAAYSYEEPVYETRYFCKCNACGELFTDIEEHGHYHVENGDFEKFSYLTGVAVEVQVGTKTVEVPEEGHYETKVIKEAWTEKVLVKEAGYYNDDGKRWHEAEYKIISHPAETKQVWVVDKAAYSYEEPIYETQSRYICNTCGEDITEDMEAGFGEGDHDYNHMINGEPFSYRVESREVQVGTKTVELPEEGHYETKVIKEAWTEKVLVKEAGYY